MQRLFLSLFLLCTLGSVLRAQEPSAPVVATPAVPALLSEAEKAYYSGRFEAAIESYQAVLHQNPKAAEAYAGLTRVYLKQQKVALAFETANQGVVQAPNSQLVHTALGEVYFRQGKMPDSEKELVKAINTPPADPHALLVLSRLYDAYSLHTSARRVLNRAHELAPNDPEILSRWILTRKRAEQIRWLKDRLSGATNEDAEQRQSSEEWLAFLQAREQQPHSSCTLVTKLASTNTEILRLGDPRHFEGYGLDVKVNGHSTHLELDTGAPGLLITKKLADKAGITPISNIHLRGVGNESDPTGFLGYADSIKVGQLEFRDCLVTVSEKDLKMGVDGLVGGNVFSQYLVTIDFPNMKLRLEELPKAPGQVQEPVNLSTGEQSEDETAAGHEQDEKQSASAKSQTVESGPQDAYIAPEMRSYTKVYRFGHSLLIPTIVGNTPAKLFLIDTGAMLNNISPAAAREVTRVRDSDLKVRGISGTVNKVYEADKAVVQFSRFKQENVALTTFDLSFLSRSLGTEVSGILGLQVLPLLIVKIDYRDGLVDFVYKGH